MMTIESECVNEEFQLEILLLAEEGRFWQICTLAVPLTQQGTHHITRLCSCLVKGILKRNESDVLNYKNTMSAHSSQEFANVLPCLLFAYIYQL